MNWELTLEVKEPPAASTLLEESMFPLLAKGQHLEWGTLDLEGLIQRLPCLHEGAGKWIAVFEEETISIILGMGGMKAIWGKILGQQEMEEILQAAGLNQYVGTQAHDGNIFNRCNCNALWASLREHYPRRNQPDSIVTAPIKDDESPKVYIHTTHKEWIRQTWARPDHDIFHQVALQRR